MSKKEIIISGPVSVDGVIYAPNKKSKKITLDSEDADALVLMGQAVYANDDDDPHLQRQKSAEKERLAEISGLQDSLDDLQIELSEKAAQLDEANAKIAELEQALSESLTDESVDLPNETEGSDDQSADPVDPADEDQAIAAAE